MDFFFSKVQFRVLWPDYDEAQSGFFSFFFFFWSRGRFGERLFLLNVNTRRHLKWLWIA